MDKLFKVGIIVTIVFFSLFFLIYLVLNFYPSIGRTPNQKKQEEYANRTELYYDNKFHNIKNIKLIKSKYDKNIKTQARPNKKIPVLKWSYFPKAKKGETTITWLGHSSILLQINEKNILIDPILTEVASPIDFVGPKRFSEIPIKIEDMPLIDTLLISHDHYDHLDYETIKKIDKKVKNYVVPLGVENYLLSWGVSEGKIHTLGWWDSVTLYDLKFTSTPAQHYSSRNPLKKDSTWWSGYYIQNKELSIYFTGDTGYSDSFKEIYNKLGAVDLLLADTGQYNESWSTIHMNPYDSIKVAIDVHAKNYIPIHWGAFVLSDHNWYDPGEIATSLARKNNINAITPRIGERVRYQDINNYKEHWRNEFK